MSKPQRKPTLPNPFAKFSLHQLLAADNPTIDITIVPFDRRVQAFKSALGRYTTANQEEVLKRREAYLGLIERLGREKRDGEQELQQWRLKAIEMGKQVEEERIERKQAEDAVAHNQRQIKGLQDRLKDKDDELKKLDAGLDALKKAKEKEKRQLNKQASQITQDVIDLERILGVTIRGAGNDVLKIVFTNLDPKDSEREFFIVLDLSRQEYQVPDLAPYLPTLQALVDALNADRDLFGFLRRVRRAFVQALE